MNTLAINMMFMIVSAQFNLPPGLLSSICFVESSHNPTVIHHDDGRGDSLGICQIKLETAKGLGFNGDKKELMTIENNIYYAGAYLRHQQVRYNGDISKAVIAYNIGHAGNLTATKYQYKVFKQWSEGERKYANFNCPTTKRNFR